MRCVLRLSVLAGLTFVATAGLASPPPDGITLLVNEGPGPDDVALAWTGGTPPYKVYRSSSPVGVVQPGHLLGGTPGSTWDDFGAVVPAGGLYCYVVVASPPMCGDGVLDAGEACDDGNPNGGDGCDGSCVVEPGYLCSGQPSLCVPTACNDFIDMDGDGHAGYPTDPGCTDISDNSEFDDCPAGPTCPQCANALDDDVDTFVDYPSDPGCYAASDLNESCVGSCAPGFVCINDVCTPAACNDNIDQDGDAQPGYPTDPGCTDISDNSELDDCPAGPTCPQCANGLDDDADTFVDYPSDPGCYAASDPNESCVGSCAPGFVCINDVCTPAACNDNIDQDGDAQPGYPTDPGCTDISDNSELDDCPAGPTCPQCANGLDDDADTFVDYPADAGCTAAADPSE